MTHHTRLTLRCVAGRLALGLLALLSLSACEPSHTALGASPPSDQHMLTIYGYNYTNRYIDSFEVDSQGGSNLDVSTPEAGGGKGTCCIVWADGTPLPQSVKVRWVASACLQKVTDSEGRTREVVAHSFKEEQVQLTTPVPANPGYFEVHFYPDGHTEVAITATPSEPRLKLDPARAAPEDVQYPTCKVP
jgi:hypothetical protein